MNVNSDETRAAESQCDERSPSAVLRSLLTERHSCRDYEKRAVPHDAIVEVLNLARLSASWCNSQPWGVIVTEGEGTEGFRRALYAYASSGKAERTPDIAWPSRYEGVYKDRQRACGWSLYKSMGIEQGDRAASAQQALKNFEFFGAPHTAIITTERDLGVYGAIDCGLYIGSFLLAAEACGLGAIAQAALAMYSEFVRSYLAIPANRQIVCGISFGYPNRSHRVNQFRTQRADLSEMVQWVGK